MSRRYGRNQKRRNREEIKRLNQAYAMADGLSKRIAADLRDAEYTISEMVKTIGSVCTHSVALPPKKVAGTRERNYYRVSARNIDFPSVVCGDCPPANVSFRTIDLYALRVFLESRREQFQAAVHLEYSAGPHSAYMISEEGLRSLPREVLVRRLVPDIGRKLVDHLMGETYGR